MLVHAWVLAAVLAVLTTIGAVLSNDQGQAIVAGLLGFVTWGVFVFGTFNVEVHAGTSTIHYSMPSVAIMGVAMALVPGYIMLTGPIDLIGRYRNPDQSEI